MSSVQDDTECKQCNRKAFLIFDCRANTHWIQCPYCGYNFEDWYIIDKDIEEKTGEQVYKIGEDGKWIHKFSENIGYGAVYFEDIKGGGRLNALKNSITKEDIDRFNSTLNNPEINQGKSYLLSFNPMTKELTAVIGEIPEEPPY